MSPYGPVAGTPGSRGPRASGSETMRSADSEPREWPGSHTVPAETLALLGADELDAGRVERTRDARARIAAEELERLLLRSHQRDANRIAARREKRGLVERQQPAGQRGCDEGDAAHDPPPHLVAHLLERSGALRVAERDHAVEGGDRPRAGSEDQDVVGQRVAAVEHDAAPRGVDRGHGGRHEPAAQVGGDPAQRAAVCRPAAERLRHQHRSQHEVGLRRDDRHVNTIAGEVSEREHELERGDAPSDDDDLRSGCRVHGHVPTVRSELPAAIG